MEILRFLQDFRRQHGTCSLTRPWSTPAISWKWCKSRKVRRLSICVTILSHPIIDLRDITPDTSWCGWHSKSIQNSLLWYLFDMSSSSDEKELWHTLKQIPIDSLCSHCIQEHHRTLLPLFYLVAGFSLGQVDPTFRGCHVAIQRVTNQCANILATGHLTA